MWMLNEGTIDFFNLSLLLPIYPFDLVLSSEHLHCKNRMYLNIYFENLLLHTAICILLLHYWKIFSIVFILSSSAEK